MDSEHKNHRNRMREKYLKGGLDILEDHEVLELLLFYAIPMKNTNDIAHRLTKKYGTNLAKILEADIEDLKTVKGMGENSAILLHMIPQIVSRYKLSKWEDKKQLGTTHDIGKFAVDLYTGKTEEEFSLLCLDANRYLTDFSVICKGTVNETAVYMRKVVEYTIRTKAINLVLVHNHPSGSILPSEEDKTLTREIIKVMRSLSVSVLDHIIVSGDRYYSMKDMGNV